jgi:nitrilase
VGNKTGLFKVAAAQAAPVFMDRQATVEKACDLIARAGREGARLILLPEAFIPGYPDWVWLVPNSHGAILNEMYTELVENSVTVPDDTTKRLGQAAKSAGTHVAIGINELNAEASGASLYNTLLVFNDQGNILRKHRKLVPTGGERLIWAQGDGSTMEVFDTSLGKVGGLTCWENYMPLARNVMYAGGTQLHLAPTWDPSDGWLLSLRHIAREGGMFVLGCCTALHLDDIPDRFEFKKLYPKTTEWINPGNSAIIGPNGEILAGPTSEKEEILYAEVDLSLVTAAKRMFDVAGHYARPDVFKFTLNREPNPMMHSSGNSEGR